MTSSKPARKRPRKVQKAPEKLILQQPFEFTSPLPAQECIDRLKYVSKEQAYIAMVAPNKLAFNWKQGDLLLRGKIWAVGHIEETASSTRITGMTGIALQDFLLNIVLLTGIPLLIGFTHIQLLAFMASIAFISTAIVLFSIGTSEAHTRTALLWDIQGMFEAKRLQPQYLPNRRRGDRTANYPPKRIILRQKFSFTVDTPLEKCVKAITDPKIALYSSNPKQVQFHMSETPSRAASVWAVGRLEAVNEGSTRVSGITGVGRNDLLLFLFLPSIAVPVISVMHQYPLAFFMGLSVFFNLLLLAVQVVSIFFARGSLMDTLHTLKDIKAKD